MSKYSGKCDFADIIGIHGTSNIIDLYQIFTYDNWLIPLRIDDPCDLVPYYPYLVTVMSNWKIHLSRRSFVDAEEDEFLQFYLDSLKQYWRRCKRKKQAYDLDVAYSTITMQGFNQPWKRELAERVGELGDKATGEGIHIPSYDLMRHKLYEEMIKYGYMEDEAYKWCFGHDRWLNRIKEKHKEENKDE